MQIRQGDYSFEWAGKLWITVHDVLSHWYISNIAETNIANSVEATGHKVSSHMCCCSTTKSSRKLNLKDSEISKEDEALSRFALQAMVPKKKEKNSLWKIETLCLS